jgi:hypothetical protein
MRFNDRTANSLNELLEGLRTDRAEIGDLPIWYRGQSNSAWQLQPKQLRGRGRPEWDLISRFKQNSMLLVEKHPQNEFEWLFLMQHYGAPTRLLDWSESPLISLWFAVNDDSHPDQDAALWSILPTQLNEHAGFRPEYSGAIPSFEDRSLGGYSPTVLYQDQRSHQVPMAAIAARNSRRIQAQQGVFTISHRAAGSVDCLPENYQNNHVWKFLIPSARKKSIAADLRLLGYSRFQLFPELHFAFEGN